MRTFDRFELPSWNYKPFYWIHVPFCRSPIDSNRGGGFKPIGCKVYISNLPFEAKWQNVKDLFTENVSQFLFNNIEVDFRYDINKTADP